MWKVDIFIEDNGEKENHTRCFNSKEKADEYFQEIFEGWEVTFRNDGFDYDFAIRPVKRPYK